MRIIAGRLGGRQFTSPDNQRTHPMSDRVRGGLFNTLGDIADLTFLDAFAGSGALSFEAISRGASQVTSIDIDKKSAASIKLNASLLGAEAFIKVIQANAGAWLDNNPDASFDIILSDPPFHDLQERLLDKLSSRVRPKGLFVLSWPGKKTAPDFAGFTLTKSKSYGDAQVFFYRKG